MSNEISKTPNESTPPSITLAQGNKLLDLILKDHDLGLSPEEQKRLNDLAQAHVELQPERLRKCEVSCPAHDICPYIQNVAKDKRPYGLRCPMEAKLYRHEFEMLVIYIQSMDQDNNPVPAAELGLCKDVALQRVVEHRLSLDMAADPSATVDSVVAGALGATKKEENPAIIAWTRAVDKLKGYQDRLFKLVENRLKRITNKQAKNEAMLAKFDSLLKKSPEKILNASIKDIIESLPETIKKNQTELDKQSEEKRSE